jgi:hypothetical protein
MQLKPFNLATGVLEAEEDRYDGIIVKPESLPADPSTFKAALETSLQVRHMPKEQKRQQQQQLWFKVLNMQSVVLCEQPGQKAQSSYCCWHLRQNFGQRSEGAS